MAGESSIHTHKNPFDPTTSHLIRTKARRLCHCRGFSRSDRTDVEQELRLHLLVQASRFDPSITTWPKFASFILDKRCISLFRERTAAMRSPDREECSLNDPVLDADGRVVDRHQTTPEAAKAKQRLHDLARDIAQLRANLPSNVLRDVLDLLGRGGTVKSISLDLGIQRPKVKQQIEELRRCFEDAGLHEYLG